MSHSNRKDMEALLREARKAGFVVASLGARSLKVTNPLTGDSVVIARSPGSNRGLMNDRAKLKQIGCEPGVPPLAVRTGQPLTEPAPTTGTASTSPQVTPVPAPPGTGGDSQPLTGVVHPTAPHPAAPADPIEDGTEKESVMPKVRDSVRVTGKGMNPRSDVPGTAWFLWSAIHDGEPTTVQPLDGADGVLWHGAFSDKVSELWPELGKASDIRNQLNYYLRVSGNMICLKRHTRPPVWWLSKEWIDTPVPDPGRAPDPEIEDSPVAAKPAPRRPAAPAKTVTAAGDSNPFDALTNLIDQVTTLTDENRTLRKLNDELIAQNEDLAAEAAGVAELRAAVGRLTREKKALSGEYDEVNAKLARIQQTFRDLAG